MDSFDAAAKLRLTLAVQEPRPVLTRGGMRGLALLLALTAAACAAAPPGPVDPGPPQPIVETVPYQEILTPVPVRARIPARLGVDNVLLYYRTFGTRVWTLLELGRSGQTWQGTIDCLEVSTITGPLQFFLQWRDREDRLVAATGSPSYPYRVDVVYRSAQGPTALAGEPPPWRCADPADCPPGLAGCPQYVPRRPACRSDEDCGSDDYCAWDGYCDAVTPELAAR